MPLPWNPFIFADTVWPLFIFVRYSWYCQKKIHFRYIFEADTPQPAGGSLLLNPLTTLFLSTWTTNSGKQAYWWPALDEEVAGEVAASPRGSSKPLRPAYFSILFTHFKGIRKIPIRLMLHSNFRKLFVILLKLWQNFRDKPAAESGLLPLPILFARKKAGDSGVWSYGYN